MGWKVTIKPKDETMGQYRIYAEYFDPAKIDAGPIFSFDADGALKTEELAKFAEVCKTEFARQQEKVAQETSKQLDLEIKATEIQTLLEKP